MHNAVHDFVDNHKDKLTGKVLEVGSFNVNGGIRDIIPDLIGIDLRKGPGVDLVCPVEDLHKHYGNGSFDACVSTDTLEHVKDWKGFVRSTWDLVKDGGYIVFTMASTDKGRHAYPDDYWRMEEKHINKIWPNVENYTKLGGISIGWTVKKDGRLGNLDDVELIKVK